MQCLGQERASDLSTASVRPRGQGALLRYYTGDIREEGERCRSPNVHKRSMSSQRRSSSASNDRREWLIAVSRIMQFSRALFLPQ